jgi:hypothetical protein
LTEAFVNICGNNIALDNASNPIEIDEEIFACPPTRLLSSSPNIKTIPSENEVALQFTPMVLLETK